MAAVPWTSILAYKTHLDRQGPSPSQSVVSPEAKTTTEYTAIVIESNILRSMPLRISAVWKSATRATTQPSNKGGQTSTK